MTAPFYPTGAFSEQTGFVIITFVGMAFGFFLERAGFASARKLTSVFYFRDWAVVRMMFTALVTAMIGLLYLSSMGWIEMDAVNLETTFLGAQIVGGLLLGMGFVAGGYCPGTSVVAAASGKLDGIVFIAGLLLGNAIFGFGFPVLRPLYNSGARGVYSLMDWTGLSAATVGLLVVLMALGAFAATEYAGRKKAAADKSSGGFTMRLTWQRAGAVLLLALSFVLVAGSSIAGGGRTGDLAKLVGSGKDMLEPAELAAWIAQRKPTVVVDLRAPAAFTQYHIPGATNMAFEQLAKADLPKGKTVVLCSADGARAGEAWAMLAARGLDARVLKGGLRAWWEQVATPSDLRQSGGAGAPVMPAAAPAAGAASAPAPSAAPGGGKFKKGASCM